MKPSPACVLLRLPPHRSLGYCSSPRARSSQNPGLCAPQPGKPSQTFTLQLFPTQVPETSHHLRPVLIPELFRIRREQRSVDALGDGRYTFVPLWTYHRVLSYPATMTSLSATIRHLKFWQRERTSSAFPRKLPQAPLREPPKIRSSDATRYPMPGSTIL